MAGEPATEVVGVPVIDPQDTLQGETIVTGAVMMALLMAQGQATSIEWVSMVKDDPTAVDIKFTFMLSPYRLQISRLNGDTVRPA